jgi:hypothetical protein
MSKASKNRHCPALVRDITPADCGEQRQSRLACPGNCPHNPFAEDNYLQLLEIEDRLDRKTMEKFVAMTPNQSLFETELAQAERKSLHAEHALIAWHLFFAKDEDQITFAERWERLGLDGLRNDERVLLRGKAQMRVALLEIHRVAENGLVEAVDLFSPGAAPLTILDLSLGQVAVRFTTLLAWIFPLPHYSRVSGSAIIVPDMAPFTAPEIVRELVQHLGGPVTEPEMRRWLAQHFADFADAEEAVMRLRRRRILAGIDATFGKAVYELRSLFGQCRDWLDTLDDVTGDNLSKAERDEGFVEARVWFDDATAVNEIALPAGEMVLGRVLLGQSHWRLEAIGSEKLARLRRQFEGHLGERVRFTGEHVEDFAAQVTSADSAVDESLAPPRLLQTVETLIINSSRSPALPPGISLEDAENEMMRAADRGFLDASVPALEGRTPREAARDAALRPKLVQLMKQRVRLTDERNLQKGTTNDINWMLLELNLHELVFDPPPKREPVMPENDFDPFDEQPDDEDRSVFDPLRPPPPPLPPGPFEFDEAIERLQAGIDAFESSGEAEAELYASGSDILDDAEFLIMEAVTKDEFSFAIPLLIQTWFAFVPPGSRAPEISLDELETVFHRNIQRLASCAADKSPKGLESFIETGPQPALTTILLTGFLELVSGAPRKQRPSEDAQATLVVLLASLVETLDSALRAR